MMPSPLTSSSLLRSRLLLVFVVAVSTLSLSSLSNTKLLLPGSQPSTTTTVAVVAAFSPPTLARSCDGAVAPACGRSLLSASTTTRGTAAAATTTTRKTTGSSPSSTRLLQLQLHAVPPPSSAWWWAVGHVVGGATAAPIVMRATTTTPSKDNDDNNNNGRRRGGGWYRTELDLPPWTPPDRLFAPVWTCLYATMGVAAYRVSTKVTMATAAKPLSLMSSPPLMRLWFAHYALNLLWAPVFFGLKKFRLGQAINFGLLATLSVLVPSFYEVDRLAGLLLLPYAAWCTFATCLNGAICKRNPPDRY